MAFFADSKRSSEHPSPYPQRPLEPGDRALVLKHFMLPRMKRIEAGYSGVVTDYGNAEGTYIIDDIPYSFHRTELWGFDFEWSGT